MAFTSTMAGRTIFGTKWVAWGTYTNTSSSTGGDITTGLSVIDFIALQTGGSAGVALEPAVNETLPLVGDGVTIVTNADDTGFWYAIGAM